jgi:hypothetical protein
MRSCRRAHCLRCSCFCCCRCGVINLSAVLPAWRDSLHRALHTVKSTQFELCQQQCQSCAMHMRFSCPRVCHTITHHAPHVQLAMALSLEQDGAAASGAAAAAHAARRSDDNEPAFPPARLPERESLMDTMAQRIVSGMPYTERKSRFQVRWEPGALPESVRIVLWSVLFPHVCLQYAGNLSWRCLQRVPVLHSAPLLQTRICGLMSL